MQNEPNVTVLEVTRRAYKKAFGFKPVGKSIKWMLRRISEKNAKALEREAKRLKEEEEAQAVPKLQTNSLYGKFGKPWGPATEEYDPENPNAEFRR